MDPAGRERFTRTDALGRLTEVVEPAPDGDGSVFLPGHMVTKYSWNALDHLRQIQQQTQIRRFRYDSLGRLTHQALPEKLATLDNGGTYVGSSGEWSDVFAYDNRSNLISHTDARGVRAIFEYNNDPLIGCKQLATTPRGLATANTRSCQRQASASSTCLLVM